MDLNEGSVPPSAARRLLLAAATRDSNPILTKAVFSLTPVRREALFTNLSSIFNVVLMHIWQLIYFDLMGLRVTDNPILRTLSIRLDAIAE